MTVQEAIETTSKKRRLRESKKEQTRLDLIAAALELFEEKGFETTNVDDIVERANYSRSTFFRYFGTKEDMLFSSARPYMDVLRDSLENADPHGDAWEIARQETTRELLELTTSSPELETRCIALWFSEPALRRMLADTWLAWEEVLTRFFARDLGPKASVECRTMAAAMIGVFRAALHTELSGKAKIEDALQRGFDALEALGGRPATTGAAPAAASRTRSRRSR